MAVKAIVVIGRGSSNLILRAVLTPTLHEVMLLNDLFHLFNVGEPDFINIHLRALLSRASIPDSKLIHLGQGVSFLLSKGLLSAWESNGRFSCEYFPVSGRIHQIIESKVLAWT